MSTFKIISYFKKEDKQLQRGLQNSFNAKNFESSDNYYALTTIFKELTQIYCDKHNYAFEFKYITNKDLLPIINNKKQYNILNNLTEEQERFENIVLYKVLMTKNELEKEDSEYIVFIDSDAIISNPNIKLEDLIDNEHEIWLSLGNYEYDLNFNLKNLVNSIQFLLAKNNSEYLNALFINTKFGYNKLFTEKNIDLNNLFKLLNCMNGAFNEGVFIVKNTFKMRQLFKIICEHFYLSYNSYTFNKCRYTSEGYIMQYFLNTPTFYNSFAYMRAGIQGHIMGFLNGQYNEEKTFIQHNYSVMAINDRLKFAQILKLNKWWRPILIKKTLKSILIETGDASIGDLLTLTPFFKDFSEQYPNIKLYIDLPFVFRYNMDIYVNRLKEILNNCPYINYWNGESIDSIVKFKNSNYLQESKTNKNIDMLTCLYSEFYKQTNIKVDKMQNSICIKLTENEKSDLILNKFNIPQNKPICLLMFGYHPVYNSIKYPGTEKIQTIINSMSNIITFVQLGSSKTSLQQPYENTINLIDKTNLSDLFALTYHAKYILTSITSLLHISSIESKYNKRNIYCFMGCRETPTWFNSYKKLNYLNIHWLGYNPEQYTQCLNGQLCCLSDITVQTEQNKMQKLCNNVIIDNNEAIAGCLNNIKSIEVIDLILKDYNKNE